MMNILHATENRVRLFKIPVWEIKFVFNRWEPKS